MLDLVFLSASRLGLLGVPVLLGVFAAWLRLFSDAERAVAVLNVFALYFGFPALVFVGILDTRFALPPEPAFWVFVPVTQLLLLGMLRVLLVVTGRREQGGTLALCTLFGNVAYLGLPLCTALFGPSARGTIALGVSIHVTLAVGLGPLLLRTWGGYDASFASVTRVLRQPLLWAPVVGLVGRLLPVNVQAVATVVAAPLAEAAAPVALFLLGIYLYSGRRTLRERVPGSSLHLIVKLLIAPGWALLVAVFAVRLGSLPPADAQVLVMLSAMPAAITTFSIAHAAGIGERRVAAVIVRTSIACLVTLPAIFAVTRALVGSSPEMDKTSGFVRQHP